MSVCDVKRVSCSNKPTRKGFSVFEFFVSFFSTSGNFTDLILPCWCFKAKKKASIMAKMGYISWWTQWNMYQAADITLRRLVETKTEQK